MSERWTPAQQAAIETRGGAVLVSAAAGSGKTSVLAERVVSLLTDPHRPIDADRLLVVTFTNAAADEVALRIRRRLLALAADDPGDRRLQRQLSLIKRAHIGTVHSFCAALLREHFSRLDIPPDFTIADEAAADRLHDRALDLAMGELYETREDDMRELCGLFGRSRSDLDTANIVLQLHRFQCDLPDIATWQHDCLAALAADDPAGNSIIGRYLQAHACDALTAALRLCDTALSLLACDADLSKSYLPALDDDRTAVLRCLDRLEGDSSWDDIRHAVLAFSPTRLGSYRGDNKTLAERVKALRKTVHTILKEAAERCFAFSEEEFGHSRRLLQNPVRTLFDLEARFRELLWQLKRERRVLEYADLERLTLTLLSDNNGGQSDVARAVAEDYDAVLVDEYQDTSSIQDAIFRLISRSEQNLFCVGDLKQSIYRFRSADPSIFLARLDAGRESDGFPRNIFLNHNFRSDHGVIAAINLVFSTLMTRKTGGVDYTGGEVLTPGLPDAGDPLGMEVEVVQGDVEDEARHIAHRIRAMLDDGYPVRQRDGSSRPCTPGDFCILLRSPTGRSDPYLNALGALGVPVHGAGGRDLFSRSEAAVLLSLLRAVDNPYRDVDVAAAAMSPLFSLTADDLAAARLAAGRHTALFPALLMLDTERARQFCGTVTALQQRSTRTPVGAFVRETVVSLNAELLLCAGAQLKERRANLRLLCDAAARFERTGGTLSELCAIWQNAREKGTMPGVPSGGGDAVRILSVHGAKGLEWPVVFLGGANKRFNLQDSSEPLVLFDPDLTLGARVRMSDDGGLQYLRIFPGYRALSLKNTAETVSEEMRILYVAMTRARQRLVITASHTAPEKYLLDSAALAGDTPDPYLVGRCRSWLDWVVMAFAARDNTAPEQAADGGFSLPFCTLRAVKAPPEEDVAPPTADTAPPDPELVQALRMRVLPPAAQPHGVPRKVSVTELVKDTFEARIERPRFARGDLLPYEKGSAMHAFMQYADYPAAADDLDAEIDRLVREEFLSGTQAASLNRDALKALLSGELGRLIVSRFSECRREYPFLDLLDSSEVDPDAAPGTPVVLQGVADCIVPDGDGVLLIDYKTDGITDLSVLRDTYERQVSLYRSAVQKRLGVPVKRTILYSFALGDYIEIT